MRVGELVADRFECLEAAGDGARANAVIRDAHRRLTETADKISDAGLRDSYLTNVPENARVQELMQQLDLRS